MLRTIKYLVFQMIPTIALSQYTFQMSILEDPTSSSFPAGSITEAINGDIYAVGTTFPGGGYAKNRLVRIDKFGNLLWDTTYTHTSSFEFFPELMPTDDGGIILACDSWSFPLPDEDTLEDILIWKINSEGVIEWQQVLSARNFSDMNTTKDGSFLLLASIHEASYYQGLDIIAYKIDELGVVQWSKRLGIQTGAYPFERETPTSIIQLNNEIYVSGFRNHSGWLENDGILYALDTLGNALWDFTIPHSSEFEDIRINSVFKLRDKFYFIASFDVNDIFEFNPVTGDYWFATDSANFGFTQKGYNFDILCGRNQMNVINYIPPDTIYHLSQYNNLSETFFDVTIPEITGALAESMITGDGGNLILTTAGDVSTQELQITKTDCLGNVGFWSDECNSKLPADLTVYTYPNPAQLEIMVEANFEFDDLTVYDARGRKVSYSNSCFCKYQTIDISQMALGIYQIRVEGVSGTAKTRFVKISN